jgi:hypothetical protein
MSLLSEAIELENQHNDPAGKPTLAAAYEFLKRAWDAGDRDRELILHLLFLAWYGLCEPSHITGFVAPEARWREFAEIFHQIHAFVQPSIEHDLEMLYVVGLMAYLFPHLLGDVTFWKQISSRYRQQYRLLAPNGLDPSIFQNRGAYGAYFAGQVQVSDGY